MLSEMFDLFTYWADLLLNASWVQILGCSLACVAIIRLFWYLAGVES